MTAGKTLSDQEMLFSIELLTIPQVAEWAKVSTKTIYRWIESGKIPVVKFGNRCPGYKLIRRWLSGSRSGFPLQSDTLNEHSWGNALFSSHPISFHNSE